jgi:hypothetical protein
MGRREEEEEEEEECKGSKTDGSDIGHTSALH